MFTRLLMFTFVVLIASYAHAGTDRDTSYERPHSEKPHTERPYNVVELGQDRT